MTLTLLWQEYRAAHPEVTATPGSRASAPHAGASDLRPPPRSRCGDATDYAGQTVEVIDPKTGEIRQALSRLLGASSRTFACASFSQQLPDWIMTRPPLPQRRCRNHDENARPW